MAERQQYRRARHLARQFQEGDDRSRKGDRTDSDAQAHFDAADRIDQAIRSGDAKGDRIKKRSRGNKHSGHTHKAVKRSHKLWHVGHGYAAGDDPANATADGDRTQYLWQRRDFVRHQRRHHGNQHTCHAEAVTPLRRCRRGQAP